MKRLLFLFGCLVATLVPAETEVVDGIEWTYTISNEGASVGGGSISLPAVPLDISGVISIPTNLGGRNVISIGDGAFANNNGLTSVTIPEGVTSIGNEAFLHCSSLTSVTIPNGVVTIGDFAFQGSSLPSVVIPESIRSVGRGVFANCLSLISVVIPKSLTTIEDSMFYECYALTSVEISEGVTSIGDSAFATCKSLATVNLPSSMTSLGYSVFNGCSSLVLEGLPPSVTHIGRGTFYGLKLFKDEYGVCYTSEARQILVSVPVSLTGAFVIPDSVRFVGPDAFSGCSGLASIGIPEGVTFIGDYAFKDCSSLTVMTIPASVVTMGQCIDYCSALRRLTFCGAIPEGLWTIGLEHSIQIDFPKEYYVSWKKFLDNHWQLTSGNLSEIVNKAMPMVKAEMPTPKTMKVTYSVKSEKETVKVWAVAFKDGVRSFANVVPVRTGENVPKGETVAANTEHSFVWNIPADWDIDLAKVAVEILVEEGELLPQELITIPGAPMNHADMTITRNTISEAQAFDALLWCYAEADPKVIVEGGKVTIDGQLVAEGKSIVTWDGTKYVSWQGSSRNVKGSVSTLLNHLYGKMGHKVLAGDDLAYAKAATRLNLASEGLGQVSMKVADTAKE